SGKPLHFLVFDLNKDGHRAEARVKKDQLVFPNVGRGLPQIKELKTKPSDEVRELVQRRFESYLPGVRLNIKEAHAEPRGIRVTIEFPDLPFFKKEVTFYFAVSNDNDLGVRHLKIEGPLEIIEKEKGRISTPDDRDEEAPFLKLKKQYHFHVLEASLL